MGSKSPLQRRALELESEVRVLRAVGRERTEQIRNLSASKKRWKLKARGLGAALAEAIKLLERYHELGCPQGAADATGCSLGSAPCAVAKAINR